MATRAHGPRDRLVGALALSGALGLGCLVCLVAGACTLVSNVDRLDDGKCDDGFKACSATCRARTDPDYGCSLPGCAPCYVSNGIANCSERTTACAVAACDPGFSDCNGTYDDGCEISTATDPKHCGSCDVACTAMVPNGQPGCASGHCVVGSCNAGWRDCNGLAEDGCETVCGPSQTCALLDAGGTDSGPAWTCL